MKCLYTRRVILANRNKKKEIDLLMHDFENVAKPCQTDLSSITAFMQVMIHDCIPSKYTAITP